MMKLRCPLRSSAVCSSLGSNAKQRTVKASGKALRRGCRRGVSRRRCTRCGLPEACTPVPPLHTHGSQPASPPPSHLHRCSNCAYALPMSSTCGQCITPITPSTRRWLSSGVSGDGASATSSCGRSARGGRRRLRRAPRRRTACSGMAAGNAPRVPGLRTPSSSSNAAAATARRQLPPARWQPSPHAPARSGSACCPSSRGRT